MRTFQRFSLFFWFLAVLVVLVHLGYLFQFGGIQLVWDAIHLGGHAAGWCGSAAMALSLLYIPRKRKWFTKGKVRTWYRIHITLGAVGPLIIAFHAYGKYFGFGGMALACMWLVLLTGIIGHYLYRRLPEEVAARAEDRQSLLNRLERLQNQIASWSDELQKVKNRVDESGLLRELSASDRIKLPRPTLVKEPARMLPLWKEYRQSGRAISRLKKTVAARARSEHRLVEVKKTELIELLQLEHETRHLMLLNEAMAFWRKCHVPLSWLMWWLVALHLSAWIYY